MSGKSAITPLRMQAAQQMNGKVLDVGSGKGQFLPYLSRCDVIRLDISNELMQNGLGLKVIGSAAALPFKSASFAGVWACSIIEHVEEDTIPEFIRITRKGGRISVITPNRHSPKDIIRKIIGRRTWIEHDDHRRIYSVNELNKFGNVYGEIWGLSFLDWFLRFVPWLADTLLLSFVVK